MDWSFDMPIAVVCPQGHKLSAKESLAGKRVKCPKCGAAVQVPVAEPPDPGDGLTLLDVTAAAPPSATSLGPLPAKSDPLDDLEYSLQPLNTLPPTPQAAATSGPQIPSTASPPPVPKPFQADSDAAAPAGINIALIVAMAAGGGLGLRRRTAVALLAGLAAL